MGIATSNVLNLLSAVVRGSSLTCSESRSLTVVLLEEEEAVDDDLSLFLFLLCTGLNR